jgi:hypothetical protein
LFIMKLYAKVFAPIGCSKILCGIHALQIQIQIYLMM